MGGIKGADKASQQDLEVFRTWRRRGCSFWGLSPRGGPRWGLGSQWGCAAGA